MSALAPTRTAAYRTCLRLPKEAAPPAAQTPALAEQAERPDALERNGEVKSKAMFNAGPNVDELTGARQRVRVE